MTREQFHTLAAKAGECAGRNPRRYRMTVAFWAIGGYAVLFGVMALSIAAIFGLGAISGQQWFWDAAEHDLRILVVAIALAIAMASLLFSLTKSFFLRWPLPAGWRVARDQAPKLFALIDEVAKATGASCPHAVMFTWEFNASVTQRPRWGWFGTSTDYLLIGLPLISVLTPEEFRGLIAHELAHLRGGHCRFGNWIGKLRLTWHHLLQQFANDRRRRIGSAFRAFASWYGPRFSAHTLALARANEFEADACTARLAGAETTARMLVKIGLHGERLGEEFWGSLADEARETPEPPDGILRRLFSIPIAPSTPEQRRRWLQSLLARETEGNDTHPATLERLQKLGLTFVSALGASDEIERLASTSSENRTAFTDFIGLKLGNQILEELEKSWLLMTRASWRRRFEQAEMMRRELADLDQETSVDAPVGVTESLLWKRTFLEVELAKTDEERCAKLCEFIRLHPDHAAAHYKLGERWLFVSDPRGVEVMERAISLDSRLTASGLLLISNFLRRNGQWSDAGTRKIESIRQFDIDDAGRRERLRLTRKDRFEDHGLDATAIAALCSQLGQHPRVSKAWLVRKKLALRPEQPWFVLVCALRWRWCEKTNQRKIRDVLQRLAVDLQINGTKDFVVLSYTSRGVLGRITKRVRKAENSQCYVAVNKTRRWRKDLNKPTPSLRPTYQPVSTTAIEARHQPLPALAWAVFILLLAIPLGYVGFQLKRSPQMWAAAKQQHGYAGFHPEQKEHDAAQPIAISSNGNLSSSDKQLTLQWAKRVMLAEGFDIHSSEVEWKIDARAFIVDALPFSTGVDDSADTVKLIAAGNKLLARGCDNPIVLLLLAKLKFETDLQSSESGPLFEKALHSLGAQRYKAALIRIAAECLVADCERRNEGTGQRNSSTKMWVKYFRLQLTDNSFTLEEQPVLTSQFCRGEAANLFGDNCDECVVALQSSAAGSLTEWARLDLLGRAEAKQAWRARGFGYADSVTHSGWKEFYAHLSDARRDLANSWTLNRQRPEAASEMISVVMGETRSHGESERVWFDRAIAAQFDFEEAYTKFSWALRPRWGGSVKALLQFGKQCAATERFDTAVPLQLLYGIRAAFHELNDDAKVYTQPEIARELAHVFAEYESQQPPPFRRAYIFGLHAYAVYRAGNLPRAYELLREIDFQLDPNLISEMDPAIAPENFLEQCATLGGPAAQQTGIGDHALLTGHANAAVAAYQAALRDCQGEPHATRYLNSKISAIEFQKKLSAGAWVSFHPPSTSELAGWSTVLGKWRVDDDGSLIGQTGGNGMLIVNDSSVGPNFEVRGTMEFLPGSTGEVQAGIAFGFPSWEDYSWRSMRLLRNPDSRSEVILAQHWKAGPTQTVPTAARNTFLIQSWRGKLSVIVNGKIIFQEENVQDGFVKDAAARVGVGAYAHESNVFSVRYSGLEIRRLSAPPEPPSKMLASNLPRRSER